MTAAETFAAAASELEFMWATLVFPIHLFESVLEAENYGPYTVKPVHEVAENLVHSTLPKDLLSRVFRLARPSGPSLST